MDTFKMNEAFPTDISAPYSDMQFARLNIPSGNDLFWDAATSTASAYQYPSLPGGWTGSSLYLLLSTWLVWRRVRLRQTLWQLTFNATMQVYSIHVLFASLLVPVYQKQHLSLSLVSLSLCRFVSIVQRFRQWPRRISQRNVIFKSKL